MLGACLGSHGHSHIGLKYNLPQQWCTCATLLSFEPKVFLDAPQLRMVFRKDEELLGEVAQLVRVSH